MNINIVLDIKNILENTNICIGGGVKNFINNNSLEINEIDYEKTSMNY